MKLTQTRIPDVVIIEPDVFEDERGWFMESFNAKKFQEGLANLGLPVPRPFVQDNHSVSKEGVLRGLHYQTPPHAQGKLVRVTRGAVFDVAVDLRTESTTFKEWVGVELTEQNHRIIWIPEGFAHGFLTLTNDTHVHYKTTDFYSRDCEASIRWDAEDIAIVWPLEREPTVSPKDGCAPLFLGR